jgi:hypothetical protein
LPDIGCFFASQFVACSKDDVAPVKLEKQAFEDLRVDVREAITNPTREAEAIRLVVILEQDLANLRAKLTARKNRVRELNANYDTSRVDFDTFLAGVEAEVRGNKPRIAKTYTRAMESAIKTIQSI